VIAAWAIPGHELGRSIDSEDARTLEVDREDRAAEWAGDQVTHPDNLAPVKTG
jgi:hypothetical protein